MKKCSLGLCVLPMMSQEVGTVVVIVVAMVLSSLANALIDAPSISLMTELAFAHGIGNGEAVTASELAVTAGLALGPHTLT